MADRHVGQLGLRVGPLVGAHIGPPPERNVLLQRHAVQRQQPDCVG